MHNIDQIEANKHFEYKGDVTVKRSIGNDATVTITDGSLIVMGNVGNDATISLQTTRGSNAISNSVLFGSCTILSINSNRRAKIYGNVGSDVTFDSHNASLEVLGPISQNCHLTTHNGDIKVRNVSKDCHLVTHNGDISAAQVGDSILKTHNGDINATRLGEHGRATTYNGDVTVEIAAASATVKSMNGTAYKNGVKQPQSRGQGNCVIVNNTLCQGNLNASNITIGDGGVKIDGLDVDEFVRRAKQAAGQTTTSRSSGWSSKPKP